MFQFFSTQQENGLILSHFKINYENSDFVKKKKKNSISGHRDGKLGLQPLTIDQASWYSIKKYAECFMKDLYLFINLNVS